MAIGETAGILFKIKGDASDAVRAIKDTEGAAGGLTGSLAGLANPAAIAASVIAAVGAAGVVTAKALFDLTKSSAELGSTVYDASQKTGLAAETISSLKVAAEQSGSSLEAVTGGLARFARTIGEAGDGSEKAQAKLAKLGVTSKDLDTALGQALKTIAGYPPGVQQMTAAQEAFGKSGADLIPFIRSFDGDLPALIKKCKELGLTLSDQDAAAADQFGDSLDQLKGQAAVAGVYLTRDLMPVLAKFFNDLGSWYATNQNEIRAWGRTIADVVSAVITSFKILINFIKDNWDYLRVALAISTGGASELVGGLVTSIQNAHNANTRPQSQEGGGGSGVVSFNPDGSPTGTSSTATPKTNVQVIGRADNQGDVNRAQREKEKKDQAEYVEDLKRLYTQRTETFEAEAAKRYAIAVEYAEKEGRTESDNAKFKEFLDEDVLRYRIDNLTKYLERVIAAGGADADATQKLAVLKINLETLESENRRKQAIRNADEKKENDARVKSWSDYVQKVIEATEAEDARQQRGAIDKVANAQSDNSVVLGGIGGGLADGLGIHIPLYDPKITDQVEANAEHLKAVYADLNESTGAALGQMASGLANLLTQWITTGKFSAKAALQMASGVAMGLAIEAGIKALYNVAEGMAMAANPLTAWMAPGYFAAAKAYALTAAVAGGVGIATGLASRAMGGGAVASGARGATTTTADRLDRNVDGQGKYYSGQKDQVLIGGRNAPMLRGEKILLEVMLNSDGVLDVLHNSVKTNGRGREIILDVTGS